MIQEGLAIEGYRDVACYCVFCLLQHRLCNTMRLEIEKKEAFDVVRFDFPVSTESFKCPKLRIAFRKAMLRRISRMLSVLAVNAAKFQCAPVVPMI